MILSSVLFGANPKEIEKFEAYHRRHPEVWGLFKKYANEMRDTGRKRYSAWAIVSRIRWDHDIQKTEEFKISNGYIAFYARVLIEACPKFRGWFQLRPLKSAKPRVVRYP